MSDASHGSEAHGPHAQHSHEVFEGKPADSIPPDEPHTPGWLPIVGAALLLAGIMVFALKGGQTEPAANAAVAASEAPPAQPAPPARGERPQPQRAMPPAGSVPRLPGLPSAMPRPMRRPAPGGAVPVPAPGAQPNPAP